MGYAVFVWHAVLIMNVIWFSKKGMPIVKEAVNAQLQTSWNTYTEHLFVVVVLWNRWNLWIFNKFQIFDILKFYWIIPSKRLEAFKNVYFACNVITHVYLLTFIHFIRQISWQVSRTYRQTGWLADWHEHTPLPSSVLVLQIWRFQMIFSVYVRKNILRN